MEADVSSHANLVLFFALHSPTYWDGAALFLEGFQLAVSCSPIS